MCQEGGGFFTAGLRAALGAGTRPAPPTDAVNNTSRPMQMLWSVSACPAGLRINFYFSNWVSEKGWSFPFLGCNSSVRSKF